jgi:integrase family protein with SAM-like domain
VARGFSELTIGNGAGTLARFLAACGRPAWEVTREDVDRVVGELAAQGLAASTRRLYVQVFKNFHAFLVARKAAAIEAAFGVRLADPVDEFNAARHVGADSPSASQRRPGKNPGPPAAGRCRRCEPVPALHRMRRTGQVPRPGPVPCLSPEGGPGRAQAPLSPVRPRAAPAPGGHLRDLRPPRQARQAGEDHHLR